jgi:hypothetical protein
LYTPSAVGSGTHVITARYGGDAAHAAGSASASVAVSLAAKRGTSIGVTCLPGLVAAGESTSCVVTVTDVTAGGPAPPAGTVTFMASGAAGISGGGTCTLAGAGGAAQCSVRYALASVAVGTYTVSAVYGGTGRMRAVVG